MANLDSRRRLVCRSCAVWGPRRRSSESLGSLSSAFAHGGALPPGSASGQKWHERSTAEGSFVFGVNPGDAAWGLL